MDKSVFYILCFLILQNSIAVLCAEECETVPECTQEVEALEQKTNTLLLKIDVELKYIKNDFDTEKQDALSSRDIDTEHTNLDNKIKAINDKIKNDDIAPQCVTKANGDLTTEKENADAAKSTCESVATKPATTTLDTIKTETTNLKNIISVALVDCPTKSARKIIKKYIYQYKANDVVARDDDAVVDCLKKILTDHSSEVDTQSSQFETEKNEIHEVITKLEKCVKDIKFGTNIVSTLETCVEEKYSAKIGGIQTSITGKIETFPQKITQYKTKKTQEVTDTVTKPEYDTNLACENLQNDIKRVLFANVNNPCVDSAKKLANDICNKNEQCKSNAEGKITENLAELNKFITKDLDQLDTKLSSETQKCEDKNFDDKLKCLQDLLPIEQELNVISGNFEKKLTDFKDEDLKLATCLITITNFNKDSGVIIANLGTCNKIQEIPTKTATLSQDITEKIKYVDETFDNDKQNAINDINFDDEHEILDNQITAKSKEIPKDSAAEQCVRNAETASLEAGTTVTDSVSSCRKQANKPSTNKLKSIKTEVDNFKDISPELTTCLKNEKLADLTQCLNNINSEYDPIVTKLESDFAKEVKDNIDAVIPGLKTCLGKIDFVKITKNILPDLDNCVLKFQALVDLQTNIKELQKHLDKQIKGHKTVIGYIVSKINMKPTHDTILEEIKERGENFTTDEVKKYCEGNATENIESAFSTRTAALTKCKTEAESAQVLKDLGALAKKVSTLDTSLAEAAKEPCELKAQYETAEDDKTCEDIVIEYTQKLNDIKGTIDEDKIEKDKVASLEKLTECLTPESTFKDDSREIMVEFLDCINAASNVYLNNMLYICCFILMLMRLM